jgi:broad specificity phosphatase PhoE
VSTLWLVRHAQASFLEADYDRLSELGHAQAQKLGAHWAAQGIALDAVFSGPRRRQIHTAELVVEAIAGAGGRVAEIVVLPELDEYRAEEIAEAHLPALLSRHSELAEIVADLHPDRDRKARGRAFDLMLQRVLESWALGEIDADAIESFGAFRARLERALERMTEGQARGRNVAAFSSGGSIGCIVASLLRADPRAALELGFNVNNASVSEIVWSGRRRSLRRFNALSHLPDPATWTHR